MDKIENQEVQVILDSRGPYESDDDSLFNHLNIWLRKGSFHIMASFRYMQL